MRTCRGCAQYHFLPDAVLFFQGDGVLEGGSSELKAFSTLLHRQLYRPPFRFHDTWRSVSDREKRRGRRAPPWYRYRYRSGTGAGTGIDLMLNGTAWEYVYEFPRFRFSISNLRSTAYSVHFCIAVNHICGTSSLRRWDDTILSGPTPRRQTLRRLVLRAILPAAASPSSKHCLCGRVT